jgi:alanyl-tRNA synthetase
MKWTSLNDLRESFLAFFESKGHLRLPSFSLVPQGDKSLLLINAGMAPLKKYFTGEEEPPCRRVATCQKCVRTLDIDNVGKTARHGTYFEMLGNFSFGDYFKKEALPWAWEYITKVLEMPVDKLWATIYEDDDEAYDIWTKDIGISPERVVRLGKADNFWEHGSGPCGPCSEIYFDRGVEYGCGSPDCKPGCDCDRYMEFWNNVFSQFNNDGEGNYTELANKNIDTGMGLERLACVMQGVDNLFEVDTVRKILDTICAMAHVTYGAEHKADVSVRVITDHVRSATFLISDGVLPSNEGRGYVLRRLIRRAARHGRLLGIEGLFLADLCEVVIGENVRAYPELAEKKDFIRKILTIEEERFAQTIDSGLEILSSDIEKAKAAGKDAISGEDAFRLYDTFGFPLDITRDVAAEAGLGVDEDRFNELMKAQKERARAARADGSSWDSAKAGAFAGMEPTVFVGYDALECESTVRAIFVDGEQVDSVSDGEFQVILDPTPFYAESGGQVGDRGSIAADGKKIKICDTKKSDGVFVSSAETDGVLLSVGDRVTASVCSKMRGATRRNHTAVHLLHAALREVLGTHVEQAGSYVSPEFARLDFSHFTGMTDDELKKVEKLINEEIMKALPVTTVETDVESAKAAGAMALFGEKYGKVVRMVTVGEGDEKFSVELCGGTHVKNTGEIGLCRLISEASVAAGVRRIELVTGEGVLRHIASLDEKLEDAARALKAASVNDLTTRAEAVMAELSAAKKMIDELNSKLAGSALDDVLAGAETIGSVRFAVKELGEMAMDAARALGDKIKDAAPDAAALLVMTAGGKTTLLAVCGKDAIAAGAHAGNIVRAAASACGGKGGGRPDSAQAGIPDASKLSDAIAAAKNAI